MSARNQRVIITGASSGIGLDAAKRFLAAGAQVLLSGRTLVGDGADSLASIHPLGRVGEVDDTSDAILYLAGASFITGTILDVDGGYGHGR